MPFLLRLVFLSVALTLCAATNSTVPFFNLRDATLRYDGPDQDLTNLTAIHIGWFGPTNLDDPLTGDLWRAANFAMREANEQAVRSAETPNQTAAVPPAAPGSSELEIHSSFVVRHSSFQRLPFRLVPRWSVDPWGTGVSQLARMVYDDQPVALLAPVDSATAHLAEQVVAKANLPLVCPICTDRSATLAGVSWMFSCAPTDAAIARVLVDDVLKTIERQAWATDVVTEEKVQEQSPVVGPMNAAFPLTLALLTFTDHESRMAARQIMKEFSRRNRLPDFQFEVPPGTSAYEQQLSALQAARPAAVMIVAGAEDSARLVRAMRTILPSARLFGGPSCGRARFQALAGPAAEGLRCPWLFVPDPADAATARFMKEFQAEHQHPPDYTAALAYDATRLLLEAIRRAGPNRTRVREALGHLSPWPGVAGLIEFDGTGQNRRTNICMGVIYGGQLRPLKP